MEALALPMQEKSTAFSGTEGVYMLPHQQTEIDRLQRQHRFMKSSTDGVLMTVPLPWKHEKLRLLDCGCADGRSTSLTCSHFALFRVAHFIDFNSLQLGTWLLDVQSQHASHDWELHGVDIGSALFPPFSSLDLRQHDIQKPYPPGWNWSNSFDIIHQRLLIWGLPLAAWTTVLRNHMTILKPGGYIQLVEAEWIDAKHPSKLPELTRQAAMQEWSTKTFGMDIDIAYKLADLLAEAGFVNVKTTQYDHGYGAKARAEDQKAASVDLWVECFRSLDAKMPLGKLPMSSGRNLSRRVNSLITRRPCC
jgi:Methyltransferase domain